MKHPFHIHRRRISQHTFDAQPLELRIPVVRGLLVILIAWMLLLVVLPSLYCVIWALWGSDTVGLLNNGMTLRWFRQLLGSSDWRLSLIYSTVLAASVSFLTCIVMAIHYYYMRFASASIDRVVYALVLLPVIIPSVIFALALRVIGVQLGAPEIILVFAGHVVTVIPMQYFILESAQETLPSSLLWAGVALGAKHSVNIRANYVPLMRRPLWAAFLVGFFYSFDELVIATFVIDSPLVTVPRRLWDQVNRNMDPMPAVVAVLLLVSYVLCGILVALFGLIRRHDSRS